MKGCTLNCRWCSNPEGLILNPLPLYNSEKCICDGLCRIACKEFSAISIKQSASSNHTAYLESLTVDNINSFTNLSPPASTETCKLSINRNLCNSCNYYKCAEACNTGALKIAGYDISVDELFARLQRDRPYWGAEGGITLTGGEPFSQPYFATELLKKCYESYMHTAVETCGNVSWKHFADAINYIDWIFFDIKNINNQKHKQQTGR